MKRLRVLLRHLNLSAYVDTFINHGKDISFPWLIAHHLSFFGSFDNLQSLDTLLTHRRGFNLPIGSKVRKIYFSDVNHILNELRQRQVGYCEKFKPSKSFEETKIYKDCVCTIHSVDETESVHELIDDFDPMFDLVDNYKPVDRVPKLKLEDVTKEGENFKVFLKNLFKHSSELKRRYDNPEFHERILEIKTKREIRLKKLKESKFELENKMSIYVTGEHILYEGDRLPTDNLDLILEVTQKMITFLEWESYVMEPLHDLKDVPNLYDPSMKKLLDRSIDQYFSRKKEKNFLTVGEIEHLCKKHHLKDRVDYYNEEEDSKEEVREKALKMSPAERKLIAPSFRRQAELCKSLYEEVKPLIDLYGELDKDFNEPERFKRPKNLRPILNSMKNENCQLDVFWATLLKNNDKDLFLSNLKDLFEKFKKDRDGFIPDFYSKRLEEVIKEVYEEEKNYILEQLNKNESIDKVKLNNDYDLILKARNEYKKSRRNSILSLDGLMLNNYEKAELDRIIKFLKDNEREFVLFEKYCKEKVCDLTYGKQNLRLFHRDYGINPKLPQKEWEFEVYKLNEPSYVKLIREYNKNIKDFNDICGFPPYGIVIGGYNYENRSETYPEYDRYFKYHGYKKDTLSFIREKTAESIEKGGVENIDSSYLMAVKHKYNPDKDCFYNSVKEEIMKEIEPIDNEINLISQTGTEEKLSDILFGESIHYRQDHKEQNLGKRSPMNITRGRKIENDYNSRCLKRKHADQLYVKTVTSAALSLKNNYQELEIEEAISDSNRIIDKAFHSEVTPYYCFDFKKYRQMSRDKNKGALECEDEEDKKQFYKEFNITENTNAYKKYNVCGTMSYLKLLCAMRLLKLNINRNHYTIFNFKKCQTKFLKSSFMKLVMKMLKNFDN